MRTTSVHYDLEGGDDLLPGTLEAGQYCDQECVRRINKNEKCRRIESLF